MEWRRRPDEGPLDRFVRIGNALAARLVPRLREKRRLERLVGPVGVWDELQSFQIGCLRAFGLRPEHRLLDIGCGPLQGGVAFVRYLAPGNYVGLDVSEEALREGRRLLEREGLADRGAALYLSEDFGRELLGEQTFDYAWASQFLYHLNDEQLEALLSELARRLAPGGRFLGDAKLAEGDEAWITDHDWSGYKFHFRPLAVLQAAAERHGLRLEAHGPLAEHGYPTRWTYSLSENELLEIRRA